MSVQNCPWCQYPAQKDNGCNYVICGEYLALDGAVAFNASVGCGRAWCFECAKKLCRQIYVNGAQTPNASRSHNAECCAQETGYRPEDYCPGGHNSHK